MAKYKLNQTFNSLSGDKLMLKDREPLTLKAAIFAALESSPIVDGQLRPLTVNETMKRMQLAAKLSASCDEVEFTIEEVASLKEALTYALQPSGTIAVFSYLESAQA